MSYSVVSNCLVLDQILMANQVLAFVGSSVYVIKDRAGNHEVCERTPTKPDLVIGYYRLPEPRVEIIKLRDKPIMGDILPVEDRQFVEELRGHTETYTEKRLIDIVDKIVPLWPRCSKCGGVAVTNASGDATRTCIRCGGIVHPNAPNPTEPATQEG